MDWFSLLGALAGVVVGAVTTYKIQENQKKHDNLTRFHEKRLEAYIQFSSGLIISTSAWKVGSHNSEAIEDVFMGFENINLVASKNVKDSAVKAQSIFAELFKLDDKKNLPDGKLSELHNCMAKFNVAARRELNIPDL